MADKKDNIAQWDAMQKQRMEKDLTELQSLIQKHFEQRTVDDASLSELTDRIEKRKLQRTVSELCLEIQSVFSRNEKFEIKSNTKSIQPDSATLCSPGRTDQSSPRPGERENTTR